MRRAVLLLLMIFLPSCKEKSPTGTSRPVATVAVSGPGTVATGESVTLTAQPRDAGGSSLSGRTVTWNSVNSGIARVNASGTVTGVAPGTTTISATSEGKSGSREVTVTPPPVATVTLAPATGNVAVGQTMAITATLRSAAGEVLTGRAMIWSSSNPALATVGGDGRVVGVAAGGPVTITATSEGKQGSAQLTITAVPVATITLDSTSLTLQIGAARALVATLKDAGGNILTGRSVNWSSGAQAVATVDGTGLVTSMAVGGPVTITATSEGKSATAQVIVRGPTFLAAGGLHTCAIAVDAEAYCWGRGGALGDGGSAQRLTPNRASGGHHFTMIDVSFDDDFAETTFSCALTSLGAAWCWGKDVHGQLGNGSDSASTLPVAVEGGHTFTDLSLGGGFACGITTANDAWCWGRNDAGQLGLEDTGPGYMLPFKVHGDRKFTRIAAGLDYTCALQANGEAYCWGRNAAFALVPLPTKISGAPPMVEIGAGLRFGCGRTAGGELWCWGAYPGSVGGTDPLLAVKIIGGGTWAQISVAQSTICGRTTGGAAWCWGDSFSGDSTHILRTVPAAVSGGLSFLSVSAGPSHSCGIVLSGDWYCWGDNRFGQVGDGTQIDRLVPTRVGPLTAPHVTQVTEAIRD